MNPLEANNECEFAKFFKQLGYTYCWDFSNRDGLRWHELYQGNELALQVDMSVPLKKVIADMCREDEFDTGYFIACNSQEVYDSLCKRVREFCLAQAPSAIPIGSTNL